MLSFWIALEINHIQQSDSLHSRTQQIIRGENFLWLDAEYIIHWKTFVVQQDFVDAYKIYFKVHGSLLRKCSIVWLQFSLSVQLLLHSMEDSCTFGGFTIDNMVGATMFIKKCVDTSHRRIFRLCKGRRKSRRPLHCSCYKAWYNFQPFAKSHVHHCSLFIRCGCSIWC